MSSLAPEHDLLLRAALLRGPEAIDAWTQWRARTSIDALDSDSQWLLPLLDRNLRALGVPGDARVRYHNVYRHNWYKNQVLLRRAEPALHALQRARLQPVRLKPDATYDGSVVLLGGAALALAHYDAIGARPFSVVEVLRPADRGGRRQPAETPAGQSACRFRASLFDDEEDEAVRRRAVPVAWKTLRALTLDPVDQLLDLCVRREQWDSRSRLFWLADAVTLLRRHPDLGWADAAATAQRIGAAAAVSTARELIDAWCHPGVAA